MTSLPKALLIGTIYTLLSFAVALLFLHFASTYWFHQTGFEFLGQLDSQRASFQQQAAAVDPGSLQDILLRDKVYYFILTLTLVGVWWSNVHHQYMKEGY